MKLRNFLYLNTKVVEDYVSAIDGCVYDEEDQVIATSKQNTLEGKASIPLIGASGTHTGTHSEQITRSAKVSDAAKFDKIFKYLESQEEDGLAYYESLPDDVYAKLRRDDFLEVLVTPRFSKMKELTDSMKKFSALADVIQTLTPQPILDEGTQEAIQGFSALEQLRAKKEIACVFEFEDGQYPLIAYLDESFFRCEQDNFVGQAYLLCKVMKKIPAGQSVQLDEIFEDIKKMPLNREQRRKMPKNMNNPAEIRDVVKGPAMVVLAVAVYQ